MGLMSSQAASELDSAPAGVGQTTAAAHVLAQMLDLTQAHHLRDDMMRLSAEAAVVLDASAVERMSTPCAQILLATARGAAAANKTFKITQASEIFRTAIADLGLQAEFSNWME